MGEIRAFTEEHVKDVARLFLRGMRGRADAPGDPLQAYFREMFFSNPWVSPEFPSFVYFDRGAPVGFIGILPRPMEFRGRPIRAAIATQFTVDRERHRGPGALELMRRFLRGPQDLSFTDGAGGGVHLLWSVLGAHSSPLYSFNWLRPLRPFGTLRSFADRLKGPVGKLGQAVAAASAPADFLLSKLPIPFLRAPLSACTSTPLDADQMHALIQELGWRESLKPSYELSSFRWLVGQVAANRPLGELLMTAVHTAQGDLCGYYICQVKRGGHASVFQIGTRRHDQFDNVFEALLRDAWLRGACSVKGQAIPAALVNLTNHYCLFREANTSVLFQARDPAIEEAIFRGDAALSRLDGEGWLRFSTEPWT